MILVSGKSSAMMILRLVAGVLSARNLAILNCSFNLDWALQAKNSVIRAIGGGAEN